jgi:hypothetical protein
VIAFLAELHQRLGRVMMVRDRKRSWCERGRRTNRQRWPRDQLVEAKLRPDLLRGFIRQSGLPGVSFAA